MYRHILFIILLLPGMVCAELEQSFKGIIDVRLTNSDTSNSYLEGGYGKFQFADETQLSLAHLGISYTLDFTEYFSVHAVASGYASNESTDLGLSEGYIQYKGLPDKDGWRHRLRYGFLYPDVSMVNYATAWTSPYTLNFDAINSWLAEEVRHEGLEYQWTRLGRRHGQSFDTNVSFAIYNSNDPVGAMLAWLGNYFIPESKTPGFAITIISGSFRT